MKNRCKFKPFRTALVSVVTALLGCVVIPVSAAISGNVTIATIVALQKWLTSESTTMGAETATLCDANNDGVLNALDMVLLKRVLLYENSTTTTPTETTTTSMITTKSATITTTTTTAKPTTTTTTTTISTGSTTTITSDTTTAPETATTTTRTTNGEEQVTTTKTVEEELGELNFAQLLTKIGVEEEIPKASVKEGEEKQDTVFSFTYNGKLFAYTLLSEETITVSELLMAPAKISGIHLWISDHEQNVLDVGKQYELPDTKGKTFDYKGKAYEYQLKEYAQITATNISTVAKLIGGTKSSGATGYLYVRQFDYNLSGQLDSEDVSIMLKHYTADISNLLIGKDWYLFTLLYDFDKIAKSTNSIITFTEEIIVGTYVLPTQEYVNSCTELEKVHSVKIVSAEEYQAETGAISETEYMLWIPEYCQGETEWISLNETFLHAGFAVQFE